MINQIRKVLGFEKEKTGEYRVVCMDFCYERELRKQGMLA